ncbi:MAG: P1 family peptidase, partial [Eggerthellaceae bacterium]|nr:P1 family peptidase [Eggerthellaceae bacterium]
EAAFAGAPFGEGNVGAGTGASVGKLLGPQNAMKAGFGIEVLKSGELVVGALVALNALGNIIGPDGKAIAGCRDSQGNIVDSLLALTLASQSLDPSAPGIPSNTALGIIVTNAKLSKAQATKAASIVHDAFARTIKPVHSSFDGDTVFFLASGEVDALPDLVSAIACEAMAGAVYRAVLTAESAYGLPSAKQGLQVVS